MNKWTYGCNPNLTPAYHPDLEAGVHKIQMNMKSTLIWRENAVTNSLIHTTWMFLCKLLCVLGI